MVFESLVVDLMNKYLSAYIENLDASQLSIGIWGGDVVLENLHVKGDALKDLDLPVQIKSGFIGKLTLKIPWKNLYKDAVEATLDGLYLLAVPNSSVAYDDKKEAEKAEKAKQAQLQEIEDQLQKKLEKKDTEKKQDGFVEKLATQVIKNIQVHVSSIHVRYEDGVTVPGQPFALGVTLHSLSLQTTDEHWMPTLLDESVKIIYKMVAMKSLSVYWNTKPKVLYSEASREIQMREFKETIANEGFVPEHFMYIVNPITMEAKLRLNPHPENDLTNPKVLLSVILQEIAVHLSCSQYHNVMELVESMDRMSLNGPFAKFKPSVPVAGNAKIWWKYAYNGVLEAGVTRKMNMFSWKYIKEHRRKVKAYKKLYKEKLKQKKPPKDLVDSLITMENGLDVFNITLARQSAEVELVKSGGAIKSKKSAHQKEEKSSWFGGWFGGGKKKEEEKVKEFKSEEIMDENEKKLLYEAIGYSEGEGPINTQFPKNYVEVSVGVELKKVAVKLEDDKNLGGATLLNLLIDNIKASFKQRPAAKAIMVEAEMKSFIVDGLAENGTTPHIISSDLSSKDNVSMSATGLSLLAVKFETNPIDESCDQRIVVNARPLQIIYDSATINQLIEFFKPPQNVQLQQIRSAAASAYEDIIDQTATGLQHVMETHTINDININLMSSFVIVPKEGKYSDGCEALVLDLGEVTFKSLNEGQTPAMKKTFSFSDDSQVNLQKFRSQAYDKFQIEVNNIQLLLADKGDDWQLSRTMATSPSHILEPMNISLILQKCMVENDANLPKLKIEGELPVLALKMSDAKLHNAIELAMSIPLPPPGPDAEAPLVEYDSWNFEGVKVKRGDMKTINNVFEEKYASTPSLASTANTSSDEFFTAESDISDIDEETAEKLKTKRIAKIAKEEKKQLTDVQASFVISKLTVSLAQKTPDGDKEILQLAIENFGAKATVRTWDTSVSARLGSITMEYMQGRLPDGSPMYIVNTPKQDSSSWLLTVDILIAKRNSPEFSTTYNSTEQSLDVKFSSLEVNANSKALLEIKDFAEKLAPPPKEEPKEIDVAITPEDSKSTTTLVTATDSEITFLTAAESESSKVTMKSEKPKKKKKKKRISKDIEIINMKLDVVLDSFAVNLSDEKRPIASIAIEGIETTVTLMPDRTCVAAKLRNLVVIDPLQESLYHHIVNAEGEDVLVANVVNYNNATSGDGYSDMEKVDTSVALKLGSLRVIFVKRFIDTMVKFGENFQDVKEVAKEAGEKAQKVATKSMAKLVERNPRIKLDINLSVPKIFIPRNSKSPEVVAADLGNVKVTNSFTIAGGDSKENPAVCEHMKVEVTDIKVALCNLNNELSIISEYQILEPVSVGMDLERNLAASWFHDVPDISISGSMKAINVRMSQDDLKGLMNTLNENMAELGADSPEPEMIKPVEVVHESSAPQGEEKRRASGAGVIGERSTSALDAVWDNLKLDFNISSFRVDLYQDVERRFPLARFNIKNLGVDVRMGSDSSMDVIARLEDILLQDVRLTHQEGITKFVQKKMNSEQSPESFKNAVHASLVQKCDGSMEINASVGSLSIIICLEFILKVVDFFLNAMPKTESPVIEEEEKLEEKMKDSMSAESLVSDTTVVALQSKPHEPEQVEAKSKAMHINFKLYKPDIILVTDMKSSNSEALVLGMKLEVLIDVSENGKEQKMNASLTGLQLLSCPFATIQDITAEHKKVIAPCDITVKANVSETVQDLNVVVSKIRITATPIVIQTITEALAVVSSQSQSEIALTAAGNQVKPEIWNSKKISEMNFWFIDKAEEELEEKHSSGVFGAVSTFQKEKAKSTSEKLTLSVPDIMIKLESGQGHHTVPLLITEVKLKGEVKDWSGGQMRGNFKLSLGVVYFNESLSVWEPLVEPVETKPGELESEYELWTVEAEIQQSPPTGQDDIVDSHSSSSEEDLPPLISISVSSQKILQTSISNAALKVINSLSRAFADAAISKTDKRKKLHKKKAEVDNKVSAEAKIHNMLNTPLNITLGSDLVVVAKSGPDKNSNGEYTLSYKDYLAVDFAKEQDMGVYALLSSQHKNHGKGATLIHVFMPGSRDSAVFDVSKTGKTLSTLTQNDTSIHVVCIVVSEGGIRTVTLRSSLVIVNHLSLPLQIIDQDNEVVEEIKPDDSFPLLTKYTENEKLYVRPHGGNIDVKKQEINWKKMIEGDQFSSESTIRCSPASDTSIPVNLNIDVLNEQVDSLQNNDTCYEIHVRPVVLFRNFLPFDIEFGVVGVGLETEFEPLVAGTGSQVFDAEMKKSTLKVRIPNYRDTNWTASLSLEPGLPELSVWTFKDETKADNIMVMGKQVTYADGYMKTTLYSPYWMVNETGFPLDYKAGDDNVVQHPQEKQDFILFSFTSKSFFSKNKLQLRICNSNFSDNFSIDAVGSSGTIICKTKEFNYIVGTQITLTSFGLTKIVTFSSYYTIANKSNEDLEILEAGKSKDVPISVHANSSILFWPEAKLDQMKIRLKGNKDSVSTNVRYSKLDSGVLVKVGEIPLFIDMAVTESSVTITIKKYYAGSSAVLLVNHTNNLKVNYSQSKTDTKKSLISGDFQHYLWSEPTGKREIAWKIEEGGKEVSHDVFHELAGELKFKVNNKERVIYYAVFVDGLQRVLLITENKRCAEAVEQGLGTERPNMEINISLQGLSVSITDMKAKREVMYMAITSSGIVWEEKPKKRWIALPLKYGSVLEAEYQKANQTSGPIEMDKYEFDVAKMKVSKPYKGEIRRFFSPGIWLQYTVSDHQQLVHAKVNRLQVDNQLTAAVFPVVLHPIPLPKTIAVDSSPKPFIEFSLMQRTSEHQTFTHIKYFKILVQEFSVKLDMGFISAILPVFGADQIKTTPERDLKYFHYDIATAIKSSKASTEEVKDDSGINFYDMLHLSPIKVHVSFSMQNTCYDQADETSNVVVLPFNALAVVLKSVGVTVSDIDDVVFKLGYFERQYQFFNGVQFQNAVTMHYAGQAIKQLYVLVFGLDVIGNPYGLVMGIAEGVTDLFYEPYQGMIQGPGEFVEGLALGAMSLLGHTVGGAAGAVSRVTGALGKGIATMTMDDDYKKKRQMQKNKPADLKEGLARGGKGLVMGVVDGLTGVVTKPMEGAKKEGAAGFFKGVGKGIIGIVARPASGVIDLASNTFEGIQKLADMSEEVKRMRPSRWINDTGILQPYRLKKAQGRAILLEVEKGKFADMAKYVDHVSLDKEKKSFLMLTDKMIIEVHTGDLFGQWNSAWKFDYQEIVEEPHLTKDGIKLVGAKTKKMFMSKSHTKTVSFYNQVFANHILKQMKLDWLASQQAKPAAAAKESNAVGKMKESLCWFLS